MESFLVCMNTCAPGSLPFIHAFSCVGTRLLTKYRWPGANGAEELESNVLASQTVI